MKTKFKVGQKLDYNDGLDSWTGLIRGVGYIGEQPNGHSIYLIEGSYSETHEVLEWFESGVKDTEENAILINELKIKN